MAKTRATPASSALSRARWPAAASIQVFGRGHLLDDAGGADPDGARWQVDVLGRTLQVRLITAKGGAEECLRRHAYRF